MRAALPSSVGNWEPWGAVSSRISLLQPKQDLKHLGAPAPCSRPPPHPPHCTPAHLFIPPPPFSFQGCPGELQPTGRFNRRPPAPAPPPVLLLLPALALASSSSRGARTWRNAAPAALRAALPTPSRRSPGSPRGQRAPEGPAPGLDAPRSWVP